MKLIINFYNKLKVKPSHKFYINLFFLKNIFSFSIKYLQNIYLFTTIKKIWKVKIFKFHYSFYFLFTLMFIFINLFLQFFIIII